MLSGERAQERVITPEEEARYLASANSLLLASQPCSWTPAFAQKSATGCCGIPITWVNGRNGTLLVTHGKTKQRGACFQ